eukprot:jgi/Chrzof1/6118/Cz17g10130.t1
MEDKLQQIHQALDKLVYATCPAAACGAERDVQGPGQQQYNPRDKEAFFRRLATYKATTWFGKPPALSAVACSLRGWLNERSDRLACEFCGAKIVCTLPSNCESNSAQSIVARYVTLLTNSHHPSCPWRQKGCDLSVLSFPVTPTSKLQSDYHTRLRQLLQLDFLPDIESSTLSELGAAAAQYDPSLLRPLAAVLVLPYAMIGNLSSKVMTGNDLSSKVTPQSQVDGCSSAAHKDGQSPAVCNLNHNQAAKLLSLCGWQVQQLSTHTSFGLDSRSSTSNALAHLVAPTYAQQATGSTPQVNSSTTALVCNMCGATAGLWSYSCSGQLYVKAIQSRATAVAHMASLPLAQGATPQAVAGPDDGAAELGAECLDDAQRVPSGGAAGSSAVMLAPVMAPGHSCVHAAPAATQGREAVAGAAQGCGVLGPGAVVTTLTNTIAGGSLIASPVVAAPLATDSSFAAMFGTASGSAGNPGSSSLPFGSPSKDAEPVFGIGAFEVELAKRRRSASAPTPEDSSAQPPTKAAKLCAGDDCNGAQQLATSVSQSITTPNQHEAGEGLKHVSAPNEAVDMSTPATTGPSTPLLPPATRPSTPPVPTATSLSTVTPSLTARSTSPVVAPVRQLSLLRGNSAALCHAGGASADRPKFDPVGLHRVWCPWVHAVSVPGSSSTVTDTQQQGADCTAAAIANGATGAHDELQDSAQAIPSNTTAAHATVAATHHRTSPEPAAPAVCSTAVSCAPPCGWLYCLQALQEREHWVADEQPVRDVTQRVKAARDALISSELAQGSPLHLY